MELNGQHYKTKKFAYKILKIKTFQSIAFPPPPPPPFFFGDHKKL